VFAFVKEKLSDIAAVGREPERGKGRGEKDGTSRPYLSTQ